MPEQSELLAIAATWPAQRVPCLFVSKMSYLHNKRGQLRHFTRAGHATPCCDNVTMFSCPPMVDYYLLHIFGVVTPFGHRGLKMFRIFSCPSCSITLWRCRCHERKIITCPALYCTTFTAKNNHQKDNLKYFFKNICIPQKLAKLFLIWTVDFRITITKF